MLDINLAQALLTETEVSKQLRVSLAALRKWRVMKRGPQFLKVGSLVRYRQTDVDQWLASLPVGGGLHSGNASAEDSRDNREAEAALGGGSDHGSRVQTTAAAASRKALSVA